MSPEPERMPNLSASQEDKEIQKSLESLRKEYEELHRKKIETDTTLQNLKERLEELRKEAEAKYGTSDVEELKTLLAQWRKENARKVAEYKEHIRSIKEALDEIDAASEAETAA